MANNEASNDSQPQLSTMMTAKNDGQQQQKNYGKHK